MAEGFHVPYGKLSAKTLKMHYAISSLMEELEAVDWYAQRADDCDDAELREILLHNMREEVEHAMMTLEWLRRNDETFAKEMKDYLFTEGNILEQEHEVMGRNGD
ncbi:ferritin [Parvularcula flava]|uniref:Ferritin n=1 Tax=Aquisalinus luteolus TaxID=1566827 RepID=A0A8J3EQR4_9PROT|nr:ferritin [Aquisalinus luteolus]GGH96411.1 ferritin [Aquisalinus luteolus]